MKCRSKRNLLSAFSLVEAVTALIILALISSSVLVVINRCMASATDSALRMQAFEVARDNMETLLSKDSVKEMVEYGSSYKYPEIQWQTTVETFYEPAKERMWVRAVCSAEYADTAGDVQTVELTHWLTDLTKKQLLQIIEERKKEEERLAREGGPEEPGEPGLEDEEPKPEDEEPKPEDELRWCGKTIDEILEMDFDDLWAWDCPEFWDWISSGMQ